MPDDPVDALRRWEAAGGHWRVLSRGPSGVVIALLRCDGGEEAGRLTSTNPALAGYLGARETSTDDSTEGTS